MFYAIIEFLGQAFHEVNIKEFQHTKTRFMFRRIAS